MTPLFSIITITKSNPIGFEKTKTSVESQTFKNHEWIVIDGDVEPDNGIYDAMNKGIDRAAGEYLIFMNAGDSFADQNTLQTIANRCPADFIYGDAMEDSGFLKRARHHSKIARGLITHHQAMVYKRSVINDRRYDEDYAVAADYKFTIEHLRASQSCVYIPKPLCVFETGGLSQMNAKKGREEQTAIRRELGIAAPLTPLTQWIAQMIKMCAPRLYQSIRSVIWR